MRRSRHRRRISYTAVRPVPDYLRIGLIEGLPIPRQQTHSATVAKSQAPHPVELALIDPVRVGEAVFGQRRECGGLPCGHLGGHDSSSRVLPDSTTRAGCVPVCGGLGVLVGLFHQQPSLVFAGPEPGQRETAVQLLAVHSERQMAAPQRVAHIVLALVGVCAAVPHDHWACSVLAFGDDSFEVLVFHRVVLGAARHPLVLRIHRRPFRHGPRREHAVYLEPEVVVVGTRSVVLDHEVRRWRPAPLLGSSARLRATPLPAVSPRYFLSVMFGAYPQDDAVTHVSS